MIVNYNVSSGASCSDHFEIKISFARFNEIEFASQSSLEQNFLGLMRQLKVEPSGKKNQRYCFVLDSLPTKKGGSGSIKINFKYEAFEEVWIGFSNGGKEFLTGLILFKEKEAQLGYLQSTSEISGTMAMGIWEKLCCLLKPELQTLSDIATVGCRHCNQTEERPLSLKIWRVLGNIRLKKEGSEHKSLPGSWYEKFGYELEEEGKTYCKIVKFISKIKLGSLKMIFQHQKEVKSLIKECFNFAKEEEQTKEDLDDFRFSTVVRKLDGCLKEEAVEEKIHQLFHQVEKVFATFDQFNWKKNFEFNKKNFGREHYTNCLNYIADNDFMVKYQG